MKRRIFISIILIAFFLNGFGQKLPRVKMETSFGNIVCEIDTVHAPATAHNFLNHIKNSTYENAVFYRVVRPNNQPASKIKIEVIQGGLFDDKEIEKYTPIPHETTQQTGLKMYPRILGRVTSLIRSSGSSWISFSSSQASRFGRRPPSFPKSR